MNILFVTIAWPSGNKSNIYTDLVEEIQKKGHSISVLTVSEKRDNKKTDFLKNGNLRVLRVASGNITKTNARKKGINLILLNRKMGKAIRQYFPDEDFDLLIASTPPITISNLLARLKKKYKANLYLLLKDIWPQGSVDLGVMKKRSLVWSYFRKHEKRIYKISDFIGCMSQANVDYLLSENSYLTNEKVEVCPNSIIPYDVGEPDPEARKRLNIPEEATVFLFSGNLGLGHGLDFYYDCILKLQDYKEAFFLIGGAGTHYKYLEERVNNDNPANLKLYSWLPEKDFQQILLLSDVGVILLKQTYTTPQFPSRLLAYLNSSMPVFCVINEATDIGQIVEKHSCGFSVPHGDQNKFISGIKRFCSLSEHEKNAMGKNANSLLYKKYRAEKASEVILNHFDH